MEDSNEVHDEENKVSFEKNPKRILKTPAQINALEKFYDEHNYPTEEMKSELAAEIGLTEKQISSWFCHRRLKDKKVAKDETYGNGRQDRSSGIIQDRGSGLRQDSCGSTKQGDYRRVDPKEVESRRLYGHSFPAADLTYDHTSRYTGNLNMMDDTSSESSSSLQEKLLSQSDDPYDMKSPGYVTQNGTNRPLVPKSTNTMGYKPSGYLKVKGEIENAAITAVKRQLGMHYREDGPPLGVEFEALPPGAFSSSSRNPVNGAFYVGDLTRNHSPDVSVARKQSSISNRYEVYNSKMNSLDSYMNCADYDLKNASDSLDNKFHRQLKRKSTFNHSNSRPGGKSAMDKYDDLATGTSFHNNKRNYKMSSKHSVEAIRPDTVSGHHHHHHDVGKVSSEQRDPWSHSYGDGSPEVVERNDDYMSKPNVLLGSFKSHDIEERALPTRTSKEKRFEEMKGTKEFRDPVRSRPYPANEIRVPKQFRAEFSQQEYMTKASFPDMPRKTNSNKGSTMDRPSSFSEDEQAETSSSDS